VFAIVDTWRIHSLVYLMQVGDQRCLVGSQIDLK